MSSQRQQQQQCRFVTGGPALAFAAAGALRSEQRPPQLAFAFAGRPRAAPFASLSFGTRPPAPAPLFSLAMARRGESSGLGSGGGSGSSSDSDSGDEPSSLSETEIEFMQRVNCGSCSRPLLPKRRGRPPLLRRRVEPEDYLICDGCRRAFHERCLGPAAAAAEAGRDGTWFHDDACRQCADALAQQAERGDAQLPGGRAWRLVALDMGGRSGGGGGGSGGGAASARVQAAGVKAGGGGDGDRKQQLQDLVEVLAPEYGPDVADRLLDGGGYALLLRSGGAPVSAATVDVYGTGLAALDLFTTAFTERGRGHGGSLLTAAEQFLASKARVSRLVAVMSSDEKAAAELMARKFGFSRLNGRQTRALCSEFPALQFYERSILLSKNISSSARAAALKDKVDGKGGSK
ncbi:hypothetical protein Rsub_04036 [Raphidocelis subcapitata]|uniref:N-acetyltransferase domain-containing protein n=1 Tax=Raphidocelis subcapitata TaxID=307507 RepID=A0A2V0NYH7_9CHLO|nr:hypothetical protein Rsub_04036 [Raphidocelis subcapitata]|eukprot:GBF91732.1 hypothetical protein Rsub_04036 [Raphidocelis subcapitata]